MAECPLPKPNTRVRFPSSAPKEKGEARPLLSLFKYYTNQTPQMLAFAIACENCLWNRTARRARLGSDSRQAVPAPIGFFTFSVL